MRIARPARTGQEVQHVQSRGQQYRCHAVSSIGRGSPDAEAVSLTDSELDLVMNAARPLAPPDRDRFLRHIAQVLAAMPVRGDGSVYRAITTVWQHHFDPPDLRVSEG